MESSTTSTAETPPDVMPLVAFSTAPNANRPADYPTTWNIDSRTKTCLCHVCEQRVRIRSVKCADCGRRVCSECFDNGESPTGVCRNMDGCWCQYPGGGYSRFDPTYRAKQAHWVRLQRVIQRIRASEASQLMETDLARNRKRSRKGTSKRPKRPRIDPEGSAEPPDQRVDIPSISSSRPIRSTQGHVPAYQLESSPEQTSKVSAAKELAQATPERSTVSHLDGTRTVIVGAGVLGLFLARKLAMTVRKHRIAHEILVVEMRPGFGELASKHCSGYITSHGVPQELRPIYDGAVRTWQVLQADRGFCDATDFRGGTICKVAYAGDGGESVAKPSWFEGSGDDMLVKDTEQFGKLSPKGLLHWLMCKCAENGVSVVFNSEVSEVVLDPKLGVTGAKIIHTRGARAPEMIDCRNVVLSAGPWTPGIFAQLFPRTDRRLTMKLRKVEWVEVNLDESTTLEEWTASEDVGLLVPDVLGLRHVHAGRLAPGRIQMAGARHANASIQTTRMEALEDRLGHRTGELRSWAAQALCRSLRDKVHAGQVRKGRSLVCGASPGGFPIIDRVDAGSLDPGLVDTQDSEKHGVWVCYGFDMHGTTLAPGAAHELCRRIMRGGPRLDSFFDFEVDL